MRLYVRTIPARSAVKKISPIGTKLLIKIRFVTSTNGVMVTYVGLLLPQTTILSRKVEPTHLSGIRTTVLVWNLLIYLNVIISKYLL